LLFDSSHIAIDRSSPVPLYFHLEQAIAISSWNLRGDQRRRMTADRAIMEPESSRPHGWSRVPSESE
jgi:hypothetical protein